MSWVPEERYQYNWWQSLLLKALKCGRLPGHVAFIMDGNRRWSRERNMEAIQGHVKGFEKLADILQWCHDMGINQVTVYAFSIENFKRPQKEVDGLLNLARDKFKRLIDESDRLSEAGVRVNVIGNLKLLPEDLRRLVHKAMDLTASNSKAILNVAFSYTSRDEMTNSVKTLASGVQADRLEPEDIDEDLIERCFYTSYNNVDVQSSLSSEKPDLLVRTSGEFRLSDFLLWQSSYSVTYFADVYWPDFGVWEFIVALFFYQSRRYYISDLMSTVSPPFFQRSLSGDGQSLCQDLGRRERTKDFLRRLGEENRRGKKQYLSSGTENDTAPS